MQAYVRISCLVARYKYSWTDLPDSLQDEMDGVVQMFTEVSSMNMMAAHVVLGDIYTSAHGGESGTRNHRHPICPAPATL